MSIPFQQAKWADIDHETGQLRSIAGEQPLPMHFSYGTALPLLLDPSGQNPFGADLIRFEPGKGVGMHTHVGAHIIFVTKGSGTLVYGKERHPMLPGMVYLVPSNFPHAIETTDQELVIIAVGNDHRPADSAERLEVIG